MRVDVGDMAREGKGTGRSDRWREGRRKPKAQMAGGEWLGFLKIRLTEGVNEGAMEDGREGKIRMVVRMERLR